MIKRIGDIARWLRSVNDGCSFALSNPATKVQPSESGTFTTALTSYDRGPGLHKWQHYIEFYDRRFAKLDRPLRILEIGVQSGGSLHLWSRLVHPESTIVGIDINEPCRRYAGGNIIVEIGSQADTEFLNGIAAKFGPFDIIVDDGSHIPEHQEISFRTLAKHIAPGGVYFIEDIHGRRNPFTGFVFGLAMQLNEMSLDTDVFDCHVNSIQRAITSVEFGAFFAAVLFREKPLEKLVASKWGDDWIPYT
jgi:2-polyprenyl-3-methyl-5-hydroxy-6-metoxy-1,4-benzoquinol methylase